MPVSVTQDGARGRCLIQLTGLITLGDLETGVDQQVAAGWWALPTVIETSDATGITLNFSDIQQLIAFVSLRVARHGPRGPVAIVAPHDLVFGVARMYEMAFAAAALPITLLVTRSAVEADEWLELKSRTGG
jgi:hypothetical protein